MHNFVVITVPSDDIKQWHILVEYWLSTITAYIQCGAVITRSIFAQNSPKAQSLSPQQTSHTSSKRASYWVSVLGSNRSDSYSASVAAMMYAISCYIVKLYRVTMASDCTRPGPGSIFDMKSYRKISWSLEATRLVVWINASLWNLTGT